MDLRELQKTYLDNLRKVTEDKLEIGSLVRTVISIEEGLVFKDGRKQKPKKLVIIGVDKVKKVCYGSVLVNTKMMVSTSNPSHAFPIIKLYKGASNQQAVIRRSQFHQSCAMFLLIHSLKNGSLKDTVSPSTVLPNSNGFSIIIVFFSLLLNVKIVIIFLVRNILVRTLLLINILVVILVNYLSIYCFLLKIY